MSVCAYSVFSKKSIKLILVYESSVDFSEWR